MEKRTKIIIINVKILYVCVCVQQQTFIWVQFRIIWNTIYSNNWSEIFFAMESPHAAHRSSIQMYAAQRSSIQIYAAQRSSIQI